MVGVADTGAAGSDTLRVRGSASPRVANTGPFSHPERFDAKRWLMLGWTEFGHAAGQLGHRPPSHRRTPQGAYRGSRRHRRSARTDTPRLPHRVSQRTRRIRCRATDLPARSDGGRRDDLSGLRNWRRMGFRDVPSSRNLMRAAGMLTEPATGRTGTHGGFTDEADRPTMEGSKDQWLYALTTTSSR